MKLKREKGQMREKVKWRRRSETFTKTSGGLSSCNLFSTCLEKSRPEKTAHITIRT